MQNRVKEIYFVTGNEHKFHEVKQWLNELDPYIDLKQAAVDLPEIQSLDVEEIARLKAREAWRLIGKPVLIDDGGIYLEQYHKFPGALTKYIFQGIGLEGIWLLAKNNPRAYFANCLVYATSETEQHLFWGKAEGTVIDIAGKPFDEKMPFTYVFIPDGTDKTFAQMRGKDEEKPFHHRYKSLQSFVAWLRA